MNRISVGIKFAHATMVHPCFNESAHFKYARIHLPVAAKCNIQCNYCTRKIDKCENRPGVTEKILDPVSAFERVKLAIKSYPELTVVGVAGPGDALANEETFETFKLVHKEFPFLIKCLSTNGLLLPDRINELINVGLKTATVTVNSVSSEVGEKIYSWIMYRKRVYKGRKAAQILLKKQLMGIRLATKLGLKVKVNTVLIPGINDKDVVNVAQKVAQAGAFIMNVIPLIPLYKFKNIRAPTCAELNKVREECERHIAVFRLCKMCRADSCGVPGLEVRLGNTPLTHF